jgi:hypothetical protein
VSKCFVFAKAGRLLSESADGVAARKTAGTASSMKREREWTRLVNTSLRPSSLVTVYVHQWPKSRYDLVSSPF